MRQVTRTFELVQGAKLIPGFEHLYYQTTLQTRFGKFLISSGESGTAVTGALKHVVDEALRRSGGAGSIRLAEAVAIQELKAAIEKAAVEGFALNAKLYVSTAGAEWELIFKAPRSVDDVATLIHAVPRYF